jgi:hypothetical protein
MIFVHILFFFKNISRWDLEMVELGSANSDSGLAEHTTEHGAERQGRN